MPCTVFGRGQRFARNHCHGSTPCELSVSSQATFTLANRARRLHPPRGSRCWLQFRLRRGLLALRTPRTSAKLIRLGRSTRHCAWPRYRHDSCRRWWDCRHSLWVLRNPEVLARAPRRGLHCRPPGHPPTGKPVRQPIRSPLKPAELNRETRKGLTRCSGRPHLSGNALDANRKLRRCSILRTNGVLQGRKNQNQQLWRPRCAAAQAHSQHPQPQRRSSARASKRSTQSLLERRAGSCLHADWARAANQSCTVHELHGGSIRRGTPGKPATSCTVAASSLVAFSPDPSFLLLPAGSS